MARIIKTPNDQRNQKLYAAVETTPGTAATTGWVALNGQPEFPLGPAPLSSYNDATGTFMGKANPSRGTRQLTGTYSAPASFENLPRLARMVLESGGTPASGSGPDYTYDQEPSLTVDDVDTMTMLFNHDGNGFRATGVRFSEFNIAGDVDNADGFWDVSGTLMASEVDQLPDSFEGVATGGTTTTLVMTTAGWTIDEWQGAFVFVDYGTGTGEVRQVTTNTADTLTVSTAFSIAPTTEPFRLAGMFPSGVSGISEEKIPTAGTKLYIDDATGTIGTTQITNRFISFNVNTALNLDPKAFLENPAGTYSGIYGRGELAITGQIRLEFDRYDEIAAAKALDEMAIRIEQTGTDLGGSTPKRVRLDIHRAVWNEHTRDARNNNLTQTLSFIAYQDTPPFQIITRNGLATL